MNPLPFARGPALAGEELSIHAVARRETISSEHDRLEGSRGIRFPW
jgi:hypothetical protein